MNNVLDMAEARLIGKFEQVIRVERGSTFLDVFGKDDREVAELLVMIARHNAVTPPPNGKHRRPE